jgi:deoxyribonuclease V
VRIRDRRAWTVSLAEARELQESGARQVRRSLPPRFAPRVIAGADMSCARFSPWLYGAVVLLRLRDGGLSEVCARAARRKADFPYVPGFLSFREGPVLLDCFAQLPRRPDAVFFDGQGLAHPRRFGLASHLGVWLGLPSLGCAKSCLCGTHQAPGPRRGDRRPLRDGTERLGTVLRTLEQAKPLRLAHSAVNACRIKSEDG